MLLELVQRASRRGDDPLWMRRHDELTGLPNRIAFQERVRNLRRRNVGGSVAVLDLDLFKRINDEHGHAVGDLILQAVAERLQASLTADILAARYGGEEFVLFIPGTVERARPVVDRLLTVMRRPFEVSGTPIVVTVSIGLAGLPLSVGLDEGLSSADLAMYVAKSGGRDRVVEFSDDMTGVVTARRELAKTVVSLQERNRDLEKQTQLDALTGLRSRRALDELLDTVCGGPNAPANHYAVAFLDIDHFSHYNKHHGDDQGDEILRQVAQIVQAAARRGDLVFRKGGEEIVVVLPDANRQEALQAAERMRLAVEQEGILHKASPTAPVVTVTVGVASSHGDEPLTIRTLMERAGWAAMRAKVEAQRNQVHVA